MRAPVFSIDAFRPSASDYCRGCLMERHGEEHEFKVFGDLTRAAQFWMEKVFSNANRRENPRDRWEADWELVLMINGVPCSFVGEPDCQNSQNSCLDFDEDDLTPAEQVLLGEFDAETSRIRKELDQRKADEITEKAAKELRAKEVAEKKAKDARRAAFEALKQEFDT